MNFGKHYFKEEIVDEKISDVVSDITKAGVGGVAKAAAKGVGRSIANVARGLTGRTKTIAFEPNWLKVLKPVDQKTYQTTQNTYANWKTQKTKLGTKKNFSVNDNKDAVLGDFSGDQFQDLLIKYDPSMKDIDMDSNIPPKMSVYILSNGGKVLFFNLPVGEDGRKRRFAMGLDNKAERAFRLIHGIPFEDYSLKQGDEAESEKDVEKKKRESFPYRYEIEKSKFDKIAPQLGAKFKINASNDSYSLFDLFNEEILQEKTKYIFKKDGKWISASSSKGNPFEYEKLDPKDQYVAVMTNAPVGSIKIAKTLEKDGNLQREIDKIIKDNKNKPEENKEDNQPEKKKFSAADEKEFGELYVIISDDLDSEPIQVKPSKRIKYGWSFPLSNDGKLVVYQTVDGKNKIAFDEIAKKIVDKYKLIQKFGLTEETPE